MTEELEKAIMDTLTRHPELSHGYVAKMFGVRSYDVKIIEIKMRSNANKL